MRRRATGLAQSVPGSHARSLRALRLLRARGVIILIKSPLMSLNSGEYHGIVELAEETGAVAVGRLMTGSQDENGRAD